MLGALLAALLLNPPAPADVPAIAPEEASQHVGEDVVVRGPVAQVGESKDRKTLFLNFGGRYPDHLFNAVIFSQNFQAFPEARTWEGKIITVRGKVQLYKGKGKPEIILERPEQVTAESETTAVPQAVIHHTVVKVPGGVVMDYDSAPRQIKITRPQYPQEAFVKKVEGTVVVEILIDSQGRVVRARIVRSVPLLDAAALQCVYQWTFQPAMKDGHTVPTIARAPVAFWIYGPGPSEIEQREQRPAAPPS
jgi:TonB family protein